MKKLITFLAVFVLVMGAVGSATAAYIDIRPNTSNPYIVNPGDPFSVDIYLSGDGGSSSEVLKNYAFDICFDSAELQYVNATETWLPGYMDIAPLYYNENEERPDAVLGYTAPAVENFDGFSFSSVVLDSPIYVGTIDFLVLTPLFDGIDDVKSGYHSFGQGIVIDNVIVFPGSVGPDLAPVPVPGAVWLLGSGLLGLAGIRRRKG
jgi:hypothetical protein